MPVPPAESFYPGERLGLPSDGSGSIARMGRRLAALAIDWACATVVAMAFLGYDPAELPAEAGVTLFAPQLVFVIVQTMFIPTIGGSPGHRLLGLRVVTARGGWVGLWRPLLRSLLLVIVIPAAIWDADQRGMHDKIAGTMLLRA